MNVLFVAAEATPYVKAGGLADVAGALPAALRTLGHDVRVVLPRYREIRQNGVPMEGPIAATFLPLGERAEELRVWRARDDDVPTYLLDVPAAFERGVIYGESDDHRRFILFARAVLATMQHLREVDGWQPDVVHCHDWHAALVINYLKTYYAYTFGHIATVFTIHNLAYQGQVHPDVLAVAGLSEGGLVENGLGAGIAHSFNFMARGILYADVVSTVSPTYAREIMTPEYGERLDGLLRRRQDRVAGILNGIDTGRYDPATDRHLVATYDVDHLEGKAECKAALQTRCGLPVDAARPLLGVVSRLVEQKGFDLLHVIMPWLLQETDAQLVLLGSGQPYLQEAFQRLAHHHPQRVAVTTGFDAALAQQIYAGSDAFLMPSRFEPCGLGQLIALRYGSVPIVRATGGLADTVREGYDGNGFRFHPYEASHFIDAIRRALISYRDVDGWKLLRERGMREDHSWTMAARHYAGLYQWARGQ
ncbi:MAG TPA: glycogen synthase GlgA [Gemmatimonas aurantiaca]|uniref:Glycogen synthase n=2 Tax=Gemmatimonas aurantiaca TaxID=173480 RepID=C1ACL8_GEMAT|nr:glycogen synthase GlgA [Gemmatimonas aurantiaca]BAH40245.1 glycogen synthase [Gemmatimonas aurantiaca T-27]HCT57745.1 glycogen synthase GlgA [Gemmatimonas aurantiaca]